jgi:FtsH-binding integral membrane protein
MFPFMPKPSKTRPKQKVKPKRKAEPEVPGITARKSYWLMLGLVLAVASAVLGSAMSLDALRIAVLVVAVVVPIGGLGYVRVSPSTLSVSKRATFLFMGISVIGFGIWAITVFALGRAGFNEQIANALGGQFFIVTSLVICFSAGAFIGELIGRNKGVQARLFDPMDEKT